MLKSPRRQFRLRRRPSVRTLKLVTGEEATSRVPSESPCVNSSVNEMTKSPAERPARRRTPDRFGRDLSRAEAASRITAFVYGNILVIAALVALHPDDLNGPKGVSYVVGTAVSTFLAHFIAESVGYRVRTDSQPHRSEVVHELRDAMPIISSATLPAVLMVTALLGWLNTSTALQLAILATVGRLGLLVWVVSRLRGEQPSWRTFRSGLLLAVVCLIVAALKWWLTH